MSKNEGDISSKNKVSIKYIENLFRLEKENNKVKHKVLEDVKSLFDDKYDYYKPLKTKTSMTITQNLKVIVTDIKICH